MDLVNDSPSIDLRRARRTDIKTLVRPAILCRSHRDNFFKLHVNGSQQVQFGEVRVDFTSFKVQIESGFFPRRDCKNDVCLGLL